MSALPSKADILRGIVDVRFVPKADMLPIVRSSHNPHGAMQKRAQCKGHEASL